MNPANSFCKSLFYFLFTIINLATNFLRYSFVVGAGKKVLHMVATLPSYRCRGAGSLLVSHELEVVDKAKMQSYLDTSPLGLNLYLKYGWRRVDEIRADLGKYIGKGGGEFVHDTGTERS